MDLQWTYSGLATELQPKYATFAAEKQEYYPIIRIH